MDTSVQNALILLAQEVVPMEELALDQIHVTALEDFREPHALQFHAESTTLSHVITIQPASLPFQHIAIVPTDTSVLIAPTSLAVLIARTVEDALVQTSAAALCLDGLDRHVRLQCVLQSVSTELAPLRTLVIAAIPTSLVQRVELRSNSLRLRCLRFLAGW